MGRRAVTTGSGPAARRGAGLLVPLGLMAALASAAAADPATGDDRLAQARARLEAQREVLFPPGLTRRAAIAARLAPAAPPAAVPLVPPAADLPDVAPRRSGSAGPALARLLDLIAAAEAGPAGYDAVHHGARHPPPAAPTALTLGEILDWVAATPGQNHAIGRYQFVPATLADLMRRTGTGRSARFDPALQDRLALRLMEDAGLSDFLAGRLSPGRFKDELARVWAGLPLESGLSAYHGYNGNRATITRAAYAAAFAAIFPDLPPRR